jgi:RNA polymerase sigma factor FliA
MDPEIERLTEELMVQARSEAWKIFQNAPTQLDRDELTSLAYSGLAMAAAKWPDYCARNEFDPAAYHYFAAYALRRIRGAILDALRAQDWVSRSVRGRAKAIRAADPSDSKTEAQLSAETGLTIAQIRATIAGVARRPVSMDAEPVDVAEDDDVEGQVLVRAIIEAAMSAMETLGEETQIVLALRYHQQLELKEIAGLLDRTEQEVSVMHVDGILAVRDAMAAAATG